MHARVHCSSLNITGPLSNYLPTSVQLNIIENDGYDEHFMHNQPGVGKQYRLE